MSEKLGQLSFDRERQPLFLQTGQSSAPGDYSEATAREIDSEVRYIIDQQHLRVKDLLHARQHVLREAAAYVLSKETISGEELKTIVEKSKTPA